MLLEEDFFAGVLWGNRIVSDVVIIIVYFLFGLEDVSSPECPLVER